MMRWLGNILLWRLAKRLKRKVYAFNIKSAKSVLIIYEATNPEMEKKVRNFSRFFKEEGLKVDSIAYYKRKNKNDQKPENELSYYYFDKADQNWLGFPKDLFFKKMILKEHHLMIDLNFESRFCLQYLASLSRANFKVGKAEGYQKDICDMTIATEEQSLDYLIEQIKIYLNMINNKELDNLKSG